MSQINNANNLEELLEKLRKTMKANNELLKENNALQEQVLEYMKKKKRCKSCKKD